MNAAMANEQAPGLPNRLGRENFECGTGWHPLIEQTLDAIEARLALTGATPHRVVEIKEKLGELRIYLRPALLDPAQVLSQPPGQAERLRRYQSLIVQRQAAAGTAFDTVHERAEPDEGGPPVLHMKPDLRPRQWLIVELDRRNNRIQHWLTDTLRLPAHRLAELSAEAGEIEGGDSRAAQSDWPYLWTITEFGLSSDEDTTRRMPARSWVTQQRWLHDERLRSITERATERATELSVTLCDRCGEYAQPRKIDGWQVVRCEQHTHAQTAPLKGAP